MTIEEIYKQLNYNYKLDDDDRQDLAIKIWTSRDSYSSSAGTISTWVSSIAKNYLISKARRFKEKNLPIPLSHFEQENEEGHTSSSIEPYLASNELSPLDDMIASENKQELENRINALDTIHSEALIAYLNGEYDATCSTQRARLSRAKESLIQGKKKERYILIDLQTKQEFEVETLAQAAEMTNMTAQGIQWALNKSGFFKKKSWKIINK